MSHLGSGILGDLLPPDMNNVRRRRIKGHKSQGVCRARDRELGDRDQVKVIVSKLTAGDFQDRTPYVHRRAFDGTTSFVLQHSHRHLGVPRTGIPRWRHKAKTQVSTWPVF